MTKTIEILTLDLLAVINNREEQGWLTRIVVVQGPKSLITFERSTASKAWLQGEMDDAA